MQNQRKQPRKYQRFTWFLGFLGFMGFKYFASHDPATLFYFGFFGMFSFYFTAKLAMEMPDERYVVDRKRAQAVTMWVPAFALLIIGLSSLFSFGTREFMILVSAIGWAATFLTYSIAFYYFEKH
ncbi:DUF3796 domain-containing protein [Desulfosporosinus shakirovi]|uniref:DUF3796 domain-containing protein n=1 Tax=Desulfosporosinus shakirovi TaxID=2885154 RepID=UPI001E336260|nr:DUF3796 domain-containing protein [Desulfosporosinus sp. SRJS8]MCB8817565.1 DUF3796 domain-containing protein [Desulfosporosinus sp. SRJS8]